MTKNEIQCIIIVSNRLLSVSSLNTILLLSLSISTTVAPARGGQEGAVAPPNVEKDGPRNSSKFDEKIGGGG